MPEKPEAIEVLAGGGQRTIPKCSGDCLIAGGYSPFLMAHLCDRCGETYDSTELNEMEKLVLDDSGSWKKETTYRCYTCIKQDAFG